MPHVLQRRPHPFFQVCPFAHFASLETLCYPEFLFLALAILFFSLLYFFLFLLCLASVCLTLLHWQHMCACKSYEAIVRDGGDTHTDAHTLAQNNLCEF